jgi:hypothetical protein
MAWTWLSILLVLYMIGAVLFSKPSKFPRAPWIYCGSPDLSPAENWMACHPTGGELLVTLAMATITSATMYVIGVAIAAAIRRLRR